MTRNMRLLASASVLAASALAAGPAFAAGTTANTSITNTVLLDYKVGTVSQSQISASDTFKVDRKIVLSVVEAVAGTTSVSPGQTSAVTAFTVTNSSNAALDFALSALQLSGGTAAHGGTDNFDGTNLRVFVDANNNGVYDSATDTATYIDELAADSSKTVFVIVDVPLGRATNDVAGVRLTATAAESGVAGTQGANVVQTSGANANMTMDTVFGETGTANGNTAKDGIEFAGDDFTVSAAALTVTKTSRVVSDPVNNSTNPKMIPGAVVEYCVAVQNAAGSADATNISISDTLPAQTTFVASSIKVNGTVTGSTCNADGVAGGSYASGVVTGSLATISAGVTKTLVFQVTVN